MDSLSGNYLAQQFEREDNSLREFMRRLECVKDYTPDCDCDDCKRPSSFKRKTAHNARGAMRTPTPQKDLL